MSSDVDYYSGKVIYYVVCVFLLLCGVFLIIYHIYDFQFVGNLTSCYINDVWHLYCPACGATRALDFFLHGRIFKSLIANPFIISVVIFFLSYFMPATYTFLIKRDKKIYYHFNKKLLIVLIVINLGYFFVRNISLIFFGYDFIQENTKYWIKDR